MPIESCLLTQCAKHDVWQEIEKHATIVTLLVLGEVSRAMRDFIKARLASMREFFLYGLFSCRSCGSFDPRHFCNGHPFIPNFLLPSECDSNADLVVLHERKYYRFKEIRLASIRLCNITAEGLEIEIVAKDPVQNVWELYVTPLCSLFLLYVPLDNSSLTHASLLCIHKEGPKRPSGFLDPVILNRSSIKHK